MQPVVWRRLAAGLIDFVPFTIALLLVAPVLFTIGLRAYESLVGFGIFDPKTGGDPIMTHLVGQRPLALGVLLGALAWAAAEGLVLAQQRGSVGQLICGLAVQRGDGQPASWGRRFLRGSLRQALALALLAMAVLATRPGAVAPLEGPTLALGGALALALAVDVVLALAGARALGDRLAGTVLRRR
jgi:uncharacterized RDD family membrane protein YckC